MIFSSLDDTQEREKLFNSFSYFLNVQNIHLYTIHKRAKGVKKMKYIRDVIRVRARIYLIEDSGHHQQHFQLHLN